MGKKRRWVGGYIRQTKGGRPVYVIEQRVRGRRFHVSTGRSTLAAAKAEWEKFQLDPVGYLRGEVVAGALLLDAELILAYREHQLHSGLSREWADEVARCLTDWQRALSGRDLRGLKLHRDILPALAAWRTRRPHRTKALKGLFRWLRQERGLVDRSQDATLDLKMPPVRAEKLRRRKVVPVEDVAAVLKHLPQPSKDVLHLLTATAWHLSEVRRFAEGGELVRPASGDVLAVLITRHKSGELTKTPLRYQAHVRAAERLQKLGRIPTRMTLARHQQAACEAAGVPWFGMGQMRHSVLTWAVEDGGASVSDAKEFAHHRSEATTKRFYLDLAVPKGALPVYQLADD